MGSDSKDRFKLVVVKMSGKYLLVIPILILVFTLSSCFFFQAGSPPVSLYWYFKDTGLGNAYFAYDSDSGILLIRVDAEQNKADKNSAIAAISIRDKHV